MAGTTKLAIVLCWIINTRNRRMSLARKRTHWPKCVKINGLQIETLSGFEKRQLSVRTTHVVCWHVSEVLEICKYFRWLDFSATATSYLSLSTHREEPRDMEQLWGLWHPMQQPEAEGERIPPWKYQRPIFFFLREECTKFLEIRKPW